MGILFDFLWESCYTIIYSREKECCELLKRGRNGFDGGSWRIGSEPGGHQPVSKVKLLLNIKANEDYALAA